MKRTCQAFVAIAALGAAGIASAHVHGRFAIGFRFPVAPPVYYAPPPVYYVQPQVVYVVPPPVHAYPAYVYHGPPVAVHRPAPLVLHERSERREAVPAPPRPEPRAPALTPRPYRN
ncbi:hypothetical protein ACQUZK_08825 [Streptococcus pyogenes]|uniref:hypothetical protein n=1 Tax=Streptococcus pyogenes TaxID=1314 RepID=UPI003DA0E3B8